MNKVLRALTLMSICTFYAGSAIAGDAVRTIEIHAHRYSFTPSEITVKKGETVKLKVYSDDVPHSLLIKDLGINLPVAKGKAGETTLTPQKAGNFNGQCGRFCGSGHGNMKFTMHVTGN
jgi:cytochrome c oxidase subunit 2